MKCASCNEEKPETEFSKSQLKKGNEAKCMSCSAQAANEAAKPAGAPSSSGKAEKACASCGRTGVQFSKAQSQKKDGKCVDCVQASTEASSANPKSASDAPKAASTSPRPAAPPSTSSQPKTNPTAASKPKNLDDDEDEDSIRVCCDSCKVFKPVTSFDANAKVCKVCADARKRGVSQTTMKDHGLVGSDGASHRKLSWIPDGLKNYLAFMEGEGREQEEDHQEEEEEEEDPDMEGGEYYYQ